MKYTRQTKPDHSRFIDLDGQKFTRLTVIAYVGKNGPHHHWECMCECGNTSYPSSQKLRDGRTMSCGCLQKERLQAAIRTHGKSQTKIYSIWCNMRRRCQDKRVPAYKNYGARGIRVCDRWQSFVSFYEDMGDPPTDGHTIERSNNDGDYTPDNCVWATRKDQARNRRNNRTVTYMGEKMTLSEAAERAGRSQSWADYRIENGIPLDVEFVE